MRSKWEIIVALIFVAIVPFLIAPTKAQQNAIANVRSVSDTNAPLLFIQNMGQFGASARFQVRGTNSALFLSNDALWYTIKKDVVLPDIRSVDNTNHTAHTISKMSDLQHSSKQVHLRISFVGANTHPVIEPMNRLTTTFSYFLNNNSADWRTDVPVWGGVRYTDLYPGIDLELSGTNGKLRQQLVARSGANLNSVRLRIEGADGLTLNGDVLNAATQLGSVGLPLLELQAEESTRTTSSSLQARVEGIDVVAPFIQAAEPSSTNSIAQAAPDLLFSQLIGGNDGSSEAARDVVLDDDGNTYLTGFTNSSNFPTQSGYDQSISGTTDAYILKLSPTGSVIFGTYIGGSKTEDGYGIALDSARNIYITGYTESDSNFPRKSAFQNTFGGVGTCGVAPNTYPCSDAFVTKLNATGDALVYSSFYGGSQDDVGFGITVNSQGAAYVTGYLQNTSFDAFAIKVIPNGTSIVFTDGGFNIRLSTLNSKATGYDIGYGIVVNNNGDIYIRGFTTSTDLYSTTQSFKRSLDGPSDIFVAKLIEIRGNPDPNQNFVAFDYNTYIGGSGTDGGYNISLGPLDSIMLTGWTTSSDFPKPGSPATGQYQGFADSFILKLNPSGTQVNFASFLGGSFDEEGYKTAIAPDGSIYVTGYTQSGDFPLSPNALDSSCGTDGNCNLSGSNRFDDAFLTRYDSSGNRIYSTFLGGENYDDGFGLAVDSKGVAYVVGMTNSPAFPLTGGPVLSDPINVTIFLSKIGEPPAPPTNTPTDTPTNTQTNTSTDTPTNTQTNTPIDTATVGVPVTVEAKNFLPGVFKELPTPIPPTSTPTNTPPPQAIENCGDTESNNTFTTAKALKVFGTKCFGVINGAADKEDYYSLSLSQGQIISLELADFPGNVNMDLYLYIKGKTAPVAFRSGGEPGQAEAFTYTVPQGATYYVGTFVRSINGALPAGATYHLKVTVQ